MLINLKTRHKVSIEVSIECSLKKILYKTISVVGDDILIENCTNWNRANQLRVP